MSEQETRLRALDLNQQGIALLKAGNANAARESFYRAIDEDPMVMDSYENLGDLCLGTGEYGEAKNYYKKALLIEKKGVVYFRYGNACFMNDEPHEGLAYYNLALSAGYDNDEMFFFMGMAYEHMNDDKMALRYIQKAVNKNPSRPDYKVKRISVMLRLNMVEEALAAAEELLLNDPELYDGYHIKTAILLEEKQYDDAVAFAKIASEKFPEDPDLLYDYANAVALAGQCGNAIKILGSARRMKYFEGARAKFALLEAEVCAEMGNMEQAIEKCRECISLETEEEPRSEAHFMLTNLLLTVPDFQGALEQAQFLIERNEKNSYYFAALYFRPFCQKRLGREEEADRSYREAVSFYRMATLQNPEAYDAYLYRAMCLKDLGLYDDALELLEFMENLSDEIAEIYTIRADIYELTGKGALADGELEKAFAIKPELRESLKKEGE